MADHFPTSFVDVNTKQIKKFQTTFEKLSGEGVPALAHTALLGAKVVLLAPVLTGFLIVAPLAVGAVALSRKGIGALVNKMHEEVFVKDPQKMDFLQRREYGGVEDGFIHIDPNADDAKAKWQEVSKGKHPDLVDEWKKMALMAGLEETPKILVIDQFFKKSSKSKFAGMVSDYMAGTTSRSDGGKPIVMLGKGAIEELSPQEMRAVIAHEFTHLALEHPRKNVAWISRLPLNSMLNAGLLAVAVWGSLPFLPVVAFVVAADITGRFLKSVESQHKERMADRGAALITGGTADLGTALDKIRDAMTKYRKLEIAEQYKAIGKLPPNPKHPYFWLKNKWKTFVDGTHPPNEKRSGAMEKFGKKYDDYCLMRRGEFSAAFNTVAAPEQHQPAAPEAKPQLPAPRMVA